RCWATPSGVAAASMELSPVPGSTTNSEFRSFPGSTANVEASAHEVIRPYLCLRCRGCRLVCWLVQSPRFTDLQSVGPVSVAPRVAPRRSTAVSLRDGHPQHRDQANDRRRHCRRTLDPG